MGVEFDSGRRFVALDRAPTPCSVAASLFMVCNKMHAFDVSRMMLLLVLANATLPRIESRHVTQSSAIELACEAPSRYIMPRSVTDLACILAGCRCCLLHFLRMLMLRVLGRLPATSLHLQARNTAPADDRCASAAANCFRRACQGTTGVDEAVRQARIVFGPCERETRHNSLAKV